MICVKKIRHRNNQSPSFSNRTKAHCLIIIRLLVVIVIAVTVIFTLSVTIVMARCPRILTSGYTTFCRVKTASFTTVPYAMVNQQSLPRTSARLRRISLRITEMFSPSFHFTLVVRENFHNNCLLLKWKLDEIIIWSVYATKMNSTQGMMTITTTVDIETKQNGMKPTNNSTRVRFFSIELKQTPATRLFQFWRLLCFFF